MNRMEQKCLIASAGMHGLLILLLVVGSAFFLETEKPKPPLPRLNVVPSILVDQAIAGGGGNPTVKPSDARPKGEMIVKPPEPVPPTPKPPEKEPRPVDRKPEPTAKAKPDKPVLKEVVRPSPNAVPDWLKPVSKADREKTAAEEAARQWAANAAAAKRAIGSAKQGVQEVRRGFADGTVVEAWGPGGAAYASYDAFVKEVYENAWAKERDTLVAEIGTCVVRVTIARNGDVLSARIVDPSNNPAQDRSVRRVLNTVKFVAPFPQGATEKERTYTINFSRETKRGLG